MTSTTQTPTKPHFSKTRVIAIVLLLSIATILALATAVDAASTSVRGCTHLSHSTAGSLRSYKLETVATADASATCSASTSYKMAAGACLTWDADTATSGATPPPAPGQIKVYVFADTVNANHGANGDAEWSSPIREITYTSFANFDAASISLCATTDGTSGGTARAGTYRVVIRACDYSGTTCGSGIRTYDINSDTGGDAAGTGNSIANEARGGYIGGLTVSSFGDGLTAGGADIATYVGGDTRGLRLAATRAIADTGIESVTLAIIPQSGGAALDSTASTGLRTSANADATFSTKLTYSDSYTNATSPTKRATITVNSVLLGLPWTYFDSVPGGVTLTSETQVDAAWGAVDKGIRITCPTVENPETGSGAITLLNRGETVKCRTGTVTNGRGTLASGTFLRVYYRRGTQSYGDTTDVPQCDTTTGASGAWTCDTATATTATVTEGGDLDYVIDIREYSTSGRTVAWNQGTVDHIFDVSATYTISATGGALACGNTITITHTVWNRGQSPDPSWRLCNARDEQISPTVNAEAITQDTSSVESGPTAVVPSASVYAYTYVIANGDAAIADASGQAKRLRVTHNGNTVTRDDSWYVSSLLNAGSIHTWLTSCSGTESAVFVLAADLICQNEGPATNVRGEAYTNALTFSRTYTETDSGSTLTPDSEAGVTTGTSSDHTLSPRAPASANWVFAVTITDAYANSGSATKSVTFLSPYSALYKIAVMGSSVERAPGEAFNMQVRILKRSDVSKVLEPHTPDQAPYYRINYTDASNAWASIVPTTTATETAPSSAAYWIRWTVPSSWPAGRPALLMVSVNVSGLTVHETVPLLIVEPKGGDPLTVWAANVHTGAIANLSIHAEYDNGTARTGAATNLTLYVQAPDGSWIVSAANPTEMWTPAGTSLGYYYHTFTASQDGAYTVFITARTSQNEVRSAKPFGILASPAPATRAAQDYANTRENATTTTFTSWRDGDLTTLWGTVNATARQRTLVAVENNSNGALAAIYDQSTETRQYLAGYWLAQTWDVIKPPTRELGGLLGLGALMVGTGVYHVRGERLRRAGAARWRAQSVIAGATLLAVYLWSVSPA